MDDVERIVKRERRRFSKKRRRIREEVKKGMLKLVEERVASFRKYIERWCRGSEEAGTEKEAKDGA